MTQTFQNILCPVDFDDNSMAGLEMACRVAAQNKASLHLMNVVAIPPQASEIPPEALKPYPVWERDAKLKLDRIASERIPGAIRSETLTRSGLPGREILMAAKELKIDLIVMATHGHSRSAFNRLLLGSIAERVVRNSACPVLVVPPI